MAFSDALNAFVLAEDEGDDPNNTYLYFFSPDLLSQPYQRIAVSGTFADGPGIVSTPTKHALPPTNSACGTVGVDFIKAASLNSNSAPDNLQDFGVNLQPGSSCASIASRIPALFDGYVLQSSGLPLTLDVGGERLQSASIPPIQDLSKNFITVSSEIFHDIPYGASLQ